MKKFVVLIFLMILIVSCTSYYVTRKTDPIIGHVNTFGDVSIISKKIAFLSDLQCKTAGIYQFSIEDNNSLILAPERDLCKIRKSVISGTWTKLK